MSQPLWEWGLWAFRASVAQANGAGGAIIVDTEPAVGDTMIVIQAEGVNSGTNNLIIQRNDEDDELSGRFVNIASGAGTVGSIPRSMQSVTTTPLIDSSYPINLMFRGDDYLSILQTGAGSQNDTLLVTIRALLSSSALPTVTKTRSTNAGDVTISTPTVNKIL